MALELSIASGASQKQFLASGWNGLTRRTLSEPDPLLYSVARFQLWTLVGFYVAEQASWLKEKVPSPLTPS